MRRSHESGPKAPGRLKNMVAGATLVLGGAAALGACSYGESSAPAPAEQTTTTGMARGLNTSDTLATVDSLSALENESALKIQEADMKAGKITNADPYLDTSPEKASRDYDGDGKIESPFREGDGMEDVSEAMQVNKGHIETDENGNKTYVLVGADDGTKHRLPLNSAAAEDVENGIQG